MALLSQKLIISRLLLTSYWSWSAKLSNKFTKQLTLNIFDLSTEYISINIIYLRHKLISQFSYHIIISKTRPQRHSVQNPYSYKPLQL